MSGSEKQQKISPLEGAQLPLKGFTTLHKDEASKRELWVEGMGEGRYRVKTLIRQPDKK